MTGGGVIGAATAYYLTHHPRYNAEQHQVIIIEATRIASGASGKSGGLLASWAYPSSIAPLSFRLHKELAEKHNGAKLWGYRPVRYGYVSLTAPELPQPALKEPDAPAYWPSLPNIWLGNLKTKAMSHWPRTAAKSPELPSELDWFDQERVEEYQDLDPAGAEVTAQLLPFQFTNQLVQLAVSKGAKLVLGSVQKIGYATVERKAFEQEASEDGSSLGSRKSSNDSLSSHSSHHATVQTTVESVEYIDNATGETKTIDASTLILAAGPWTTTLLPEAPISAMRTHSITVKPKKELSPFCLYTEIHRADRASRPTAESRRDEIAGLFPKSRPGGGIVSPLADKPLHRMMSPEIYARPNRELYICSQSDTDVPLPATTEDVEVSAQYCQALADSLRGVFAPDVLSSKPVITSRRACYLPTVDNGASGGPIVGPTGSAEGLILASGHGCWGMQNAPATGLVISEMVFDGHAKSADVSALNPTRVM